MRGSRTDGQAVHLLAVALHACQTVITQRQVAAKSSEIPAFAPLLNRIDLRGVVVTADAMHTQRAHAEDLMAAGGHHVLVIKGNQKKLRKQVRQHAPSKRWRSSVADQPEDRQAEAETLYAVTSFPPPQANPAQLAELVKNHSSVEALLHGRDVAFGEDVSRIRTGTAPGAMATPRNLAAPAHSLRTHRP